jgi:hypothetical protein
VKENAASVPTLDEWVEQNAPHLKQNLAANLHVYFPDMEPEERDNLLRLHLIMVRDWAEHRKD